MKIKFADKKSKMEVPDEVFKTKPSKNLVAQVFRVYKLAQKKSAHTKTRSERSGGGAKPWRQKGTGRARHGSIRSPIWRKGGVTFGPRKTDNYQKRVNKKMKKKALRAVLSDRHQENMVYIIKNLPNKRKTKKWEEFISQLDIKNPGKILFVLTKKEYEKKSRYLRNIPYITVGQVSDLNVYNLLNHDQLIISQQAAKKRFKQLIDK